MDEHMRERQPVHELMNEIDVGAGGGDRLPLAGLVAEHSPDQSDENRQQQAAPPQRRKGRQAVSATLNPPSSRVYPSHVLPPAHNNFSGTLKRFFQFATRAAAPCSVKRLGSG